MSYTEHPAEKAFRQGAAAIQRGAAAAGADPEAEFAAMVRRHDLTYDFADDPHQWRRGSASYWAIVKAAEGLRRPRAVEIWNDEVRRKSIPDTWGLFLWKVDTPAKRTAG